MTKKASPEFTQMMQQDGYGLATAQIIYRLPDHTNLLQEYIWQEFDICPKFPVLQKFLDFWEREIEGAIFEVVVGHQQLIKPAEFRLIDKEILLN